ncbi:transposase [Streptomyces sp. GD-15H]|uniref:transposase n=1 Tax=Streptomyces sp. GD-15H TaxID=3129112 RepID=UPI0032493AA4
MTDHEMYPAEELAVLYARRWEIGLVFDEIKTHQRGRPVLRSQTPGGVRQEIYAHLIVHYATRDLLDEAARPHRGIAERTSFTRALHVVRRSVISPSGFPPQLASGTDASNSLKSVAVCCPAADPVTALARSVPASPTTPAKPLVSPPTAVVHRSPWP